MRFPGMPNPRWWEFEEGATNLGAIDAAPDDVGRLLLLEFATVYGTDFLYLPVDLDVSTLAWVSELTVTTSFGDRVSVPSAEQFDGGSGAWSMFRLSTDRGGPRDRHGFLVLPPTAAPAQHGPELERVVLLRDEMANLAWAVEERVQDPIGRTVVPHQQLLESGLDVEVPASTSLTYRLATAAPEHWQPLVPLQQQAFDTVVLEAVGLQEPQSSLLRPQPYRLAEEELTATGLVVTRAWQRTRWLDGTTHAWVGWRRRVGRGEGYIGLRFDTVDGR